MSLKASLPNRSCDVQSLSQAGLAGR